MTGQRKKVVVFGIDGGTMDLVVPWAERGELPNLARLMGGGASGCLRSTTHPLTPQAWASFLTGVNPGKHGVFDFGQRRPDSYELRLTDSGCRRAPAIWSHLERYDLTTGVINVPLTFPPEPVYGFQISGMHTPSVREGVGPANLLDDVPAEIASAYQIDVMSPWYQDMDLFLSDLHRMARARARLATHLYVKHRPDLFILVMVAVDRVCHALYSQMEHPLEHGREGRAGWKYSQEILEAYRTVDRALGDLLAVIDDDTVVIVMSDHGFGTLDRDVSLNQHLIASGLMSFSPAKVRRALPVVNVPAGAAGRSNLEALMERVKQAIPPIRWWSDRAIRQGRIPGKLRKWEYIDWEQTLAYSHGFFGNIYINLEGREPEGCVKPKDYDMVRDQIIEALATLTDPEDGDKIVDHVYRREELYSGPYTEEAPDLVVIMRDYGYITRGGNELSQMDTVTRPAVNHTGNHRLDGMLVMKGPGIQKGVKVMGAHIMDVMPTILQLMDLPVTEDLDGRVIEEALDDPEHMVSVARRVTEGKEPGRRLSSAEEQLIRARLKNLGYFE